MKKAKKAKKKKSQKLISSAFLFHTGHLSGWLASDVIHARWNFTMPIS